MSDSTLKIGTRDSKLAVWQAEEVKRLLAEKGVNSKLVFIKSPADRDLTTPLHQFGNVGVFTKMLDDALLNGEVDLAVHSLKDYPTLPVNGIKLAAVLERASYEDILVYKNLESVDAYATVATGSIRRKAQWLSKFPKNNVVGLRGNVQTRLQKLEDNDWHGAIFAKAGLERIDVLPENHEIIDWMIPAPAQGVIGITCLSENNTLLANLDSINHKPTHITSTVERAFLRKMEGGCSAPIGALAIIEGNLIRFKGGVFSLDGKESSIVEFKSPIDDYESLGENAAMECLRQGGEAIMQSFRDEQ